MNEWLIGLGSLSIGALLGGLFFGGLWWTVRKSLVSERPAVWILTSLLLRMGITLAGFYWVGNGHWERLILCLFGFLIVRQLITRRLKPGEPICTLAQTR